MARPKKSELIGIEDGFHGLLVGPCDRGSIRAETKCRLVTETEVLVVDRFDCTYSEWVTMFRETIHRSAELGWPGRPDPSVLLNDQQRAEAALARQALTPLEVGQDMCIEWREQGWVVRGGFDSYLVEVVPPFWAPVEVYPEGPVVFETPGEALAAALLVRAIQEGRSMRCEAALKQLGRHEAASLVHDSAANGIADEAQEAALAPGAVGKGRRRSAEETLVKPEPTTQPKRRETRSRKKSKKPRRPHAFPRASVSPGLKGTPESPFAALDALRAARKKQRESRSPG